MDDLFNACMAFVLQQEGAFQDKHDDPGNWTGGKVGAGELRGTNFGISAASYPALDIRNLTREDATAIYHRDFWTPLGLALLPPPVALAVFDAAVNEGPVTAVRWLQRMLGVTADGVIGPETSHAAAKAPRATMKEYLRRRIMHYIADKDFFIFGQDWIARVLDCEEAAIGLG